MQYLPYHVLKCLMLASTVAASKLPKISLEYVFTAYHEAWSKTLLTEKPYNVCGKLLRPVVSCDVVV